MITFFVVGGVLLVVVVSVFVVLAKMLFGPSDREWPEREFTDEERRAAKWASFTQRQNERSWDRMSDRED